MLVRSAARGTALLHTAQPAALFTRAASEPPSPRRSDVASGVPRNIFITFILCPMIGACTKTAILAVFGGLHPRVGALSQPSLHLASRAMPSCADAIP